jgi:tRNA(Leu) C34 or U34 (ribose-2'-O)-methylase TrmL
MKDQSKGRGYACIGLDHPKCDKNIGCALRACGVYGASLMAVSGKRYSGSSTDTMKAFKHIPLLQVTDLKSVLPKNCIPVAVDIVDRARPLFNYIHPERAFYIFGAEDRTLNEEILSWCRDVVYIPTDRCMNLAATVNVILYDRMLKSKKNTHNSSNPLRRL